METQTETPTRKVPISLEVFRALERKAKAENRTPDECAQSLLLRAMHKKEPKTKKKAKGICDIVGCENEATVRGQTMRFCYEHYCKITANDGSTIENEEFFVGSHKIKKATREHLEKVKDDHLLDIICGTSEVRVDIEGELLKEFEFVKKDLGLEDDAEVIRVLINKKYKQLFPKKA